MTRLSPVPSRAEITQRRQDLGLNDGPAVLSALSAFGRGEATRSQQAMVMQFILSDLCEIYAASDPKYTERQAAYADGRRSVAQALMSLCNIGLAVMVAEEESKNVT